MPKNIFISVILLAYILLAFIFFNACIFIHPVGEEEYEILVSLLAGTFKKAKRGLKRGKIGNKMSEWIVKHHIPSQI